MQKPVDVSIVIPLLNEEQSLSPLNDWIFKVFKSQSLSFELIYIDDGSTDKSWRFILDLSKKYPNIKGIRFAKNFGKSQALHAGFESSNGKYIITLDADLQDSPEEIPQLIKSLNEGGYDLISGWKKKRFDSILFKNLPSKLFNWAARRVSGINLNDFNCGIKVYRNEVIKNIDVYGEMHRYIPLLAAQEGFNKIGEQIVKHQARKFGRTKLVLIVFLRVF
jgi:glycosyltransferase involved in cell wall biosynthesis